MNSPGLSGKRGGEASPPYRESRIGVSLGLALPPRRGIQLSMAKPQSQILFGCDESCVTQAVKLLLADSCEVTERASFAEFVREASTRGFDLVIAYGNCLGEVTMMQAKKRAANGPVGQSDGLVVRESGHEALSHNRLPARLDLVRTKAGDRYGRSLFVWVALLGCQI